MINENKTKNKVKSIMRANICHSPWFEVCVGNIDVAVEANDTLAFEWYDDCQG